MASQAIAAASLQSEPVEGLRVAGSDSARAYAAAGICILCLFVGSIDGGLCNEAQYPTVAVTTGRGYKPPEPYVIRKRSGLVMPVAEISPIPPKRRGERKHGEITNLVAQLAGVPQPDAGDGRTAHVLQSARDRERQQALEREQEWGRAEALVRALVSKVRAEFDATRSAAAAAPTKQPRPLTAEMLTRELTALESELEAARAISREAIQASEAGMKLTQALERERQRSDDLARELATVRAKLEAERAPVGSGLEAAQAVPAITEQEFKQQQEKVVALARDLASAREEFDEAQNAAWEAKQAIAEASAQKQVVERELEQQQIAAERLARDLASLRTEHDAAQTSGSEAARAAAAMVEQYRALERELEQQQDKAEILAHELASARAELDAARLAGLEGAQAAAAGAEQNQVLERELKQQRDRVAVASEQIADLAAERDRASSLERDLATARDQLAAYVRSDAANVARGEVEQRQALENELKQQRDGAEALARELVLVRTELDNAHAVADEVARHVEASKIEHEQALKKERDRAETVTRELALERMQTDERSIRLAAAYAEALEVTETSKASAWEQKAALAAERDRADGVARELAAVRDKLDAGNRQLAALKAFWTPAAVDGLPEWVATSRSVTAEGTFRHPRQASVQAAAFSLQSSSTPEAKRPAAQSDAYARGPVPESNAAVSSPPTPVRAVPRSLVDEQRLLARAIALLREANISGARPLLEHAAQRGSARAAFMLAETYDDLVLLSWRVRGIVGDTAKARELYELADLGGIEDAKERIKKLQKLSVRSSPTQGR